MNKKLEDLEKELLDLRESNKSQWNNYGSELSAGEMLKKEADLERKIETLKHENEWKKNKHLFGSNEKSMSFEEDPKHIIDD